MKQMMNIDMDLLGVILITVLALVTAKSMEVSCPSTIYVEIGDKLKLSCSSQGGVKAAYWIRDGSVDTTEAVASIVSDKKGGSGVDNGAYDITPKGDLKISSFTIDKEGTYTFVVYNKKDKEGIASVNVIGIVKPRTRYPEIDFMSGESPPNNEMELKCKVDGARPEVRLSWLMQTESEERNLTGSHSPVLRTTPNEDGTFSTKSILRFTRQEGEVTLLCLAQGPALPDGARRVSQIIPRRLDAEVSITIEQTPTKKLTTTRRVTKKTLRKTTQSLPMDTTTTIGPRETNRTSPNIFFTNPKLHSKTPKTAESEQNVMSEIQTEDYRIVLRNGIMISVSVALVIWVVLLIVLHHPYRKRRKAAMFKSKQSDI